METACLASISIAFTTIIQMTALTLTSTWGHGWGMAAWVMWWVTTAMATVACIGLPYVFTKVEGPTIDEVPPGVLLPLIAALTAAAGGGVVCRYSGIDAALQMPVVIVSYLLIGLALPLSVVVQAVFFGRLFDKAFPVQDKVYQLMILCGPLGQGSFALTALGNVVSRGLFATYSNSSFVSASGGSTVAIVSEWLGILTWGYGTFWWTFACIAIMHYLITTPKALLSLEKTLSAWAIVFPWGVYTNGAVQLGVVLHSRAFWVWQTVLVLLLVMIWLAAMGALIYGVGHGLLLGLDRGWRGRYYSHSAEERKDERQRTGQTGDGDLLINGSDGGGGNEQVQQNGLRHREV